MKWTNAGWSAQTLLPIVHLPPNLFSILWLSERWVIYHKVNWAPFLPIAHEIENVRTTDKTEKKEERDEKMEEQKK